MRTNSLLAILGLFSSTQAFAAPKVIYELPATQTSDAAHYVLTESGLTEDANSVRTLTFKLPEDLVGKSDETLVLVEIKPATPSDFSFFTDGKVSASCTDVTGGLNCVLHYPVSYLSSVDLESVEAALIPKFGNDHEGLKTALARAARFRSEPQGSIQILF